MAIGDFDSREHAEEAFQRMASQHKDFASSEADDTVDQPEPKENEGSSTPAEVSPPAPIYSEPPKAKSCSVADCNNSIFSRELCSKHYQRERRKERENAA
jgi:hypothetical protein